MHSSAISHLDHLPVLDGVLKVFLLARLLLQIRGQLGEQLLEVCHEDGVVVPLEVDPHGPEGGVVVDEAGHAEVGEEVVELLLLVRWLRKANIL